MPAVREALYAYHGLAKMVWGDVSDAQLASGASLGEVAGAWQVTWQPIETAPKDGTHILAYWEGYTRPFVTWWNQQDRVFVSDGSILFGEIGETPTHWMPFPDLPTTGGT